MSDLVPWRGVVKVEQREGEDVLRLHLECGHQEMWRDNDPPVATKCCTCDPPTFRGQPFKHPLLGHLELPKDDPQ